MNLPDEKREELRAAILDWPNAAWLRLPGPVDLTPDLTRHLAPLLARWLAEAWREGYQAGETDWHDGKSDNPYRADAAEAAWGGE